MGKVHDQLQNSPPKEAPSANEGAEGEGDEMVPMELPDDMTKPEYR